MNNSHLSATMATRPRLSDARTLYREGVIAGLIAASTIALWFFILDLITGRPFYTPNVLAMALFRPDQLSSSGMTGTSWAMVLAFTCIHAMVFMLLGAAASRLLGVVDRHPHVGFGVVILFVVFMFGFVGWAMLFAEPVLRALTLPAIMVGNLLAAGAMAGYLRRRHPSLKILP